MSQRFALGGQKFSLDQWLNAYVLAHPRTDLLAVDPISRQHLDRTTQALVLARALRARPDILDWLHGDRLEDLSRIRPLL